MNSTLWGVPFKLGVDPNGNSTNLRQGIAHLISKDGFIEQNLHGAGWKADCFAPTSQLAPPKGVGSLMCPLPGDNPIPANGNIPSWNVCSWDQIFPNCQSAYSRGSSWDAGGAVLEGSLDFCAAADHFIKAGIAAAKDPKTCVLKNLSSAARAQVVYLWLPPTESGRMLKALGDALANVINELMNLPAVVECGANSSGLDCMLGADLHLSAPSATGKVPEWKDLLEQINGAYFNPVTNCVGKPWNIAVLGLDLSASIDQSYWVYNSRFSFNAYSNPAFDHWSNMIEFNDTNSNGYLLSAEAAEYILGSEAVTIPVWSDAGRFVYLNGWTDVVNQEGVGPPNWWTTLNGWNPRPAITGNIRWGFQESTVRLNPFTSLSYWDRSVLAEIYDTLLVSNPYSPNNLFSWMLNQYNFLSPQPGDPAGTAVDIAFNLRNDLFFHDGVQLTASDVMFSLLTLTSAAAGSVIDILGVRIQNDYNFIVSFAHDGPFALYNLGSIPVIPQHIWAADKTSKCSAQGSATCSVNLDLVNGPLSDLISNHELIGSGPFVCKDISSGQVGGGCTSTGNSSVSGGGVIVLRRNGLGQSGTLGSAYFRSSAKYKQWEWANFIDTGTSQGIVDIQDVSAASACLNKPATGSCAHWDFPAATISCVATAGTCNSGSLAGLGGNNDGTVDFVEVQQVNRWFNVAWTSPIAYGLLVGAQTTPQTLYEGGVEYTP